MIKLRPNEESFPVRPVGIRYICEFCHEGQMITTGEAAKALVFSEPPKFLIPHRCNKCGKEMKLPRTYPYIEWEVVEDDAN